MLTGVGCQKALRMTKNELYKLSLKNVKDKHKIDIKLVKILKYNIYKIVKNFDGYLIHKCNFFKNFNGRDIDILYFKEKSLNKIIDNSIVRNLENNAFRIHLSNLKNKNFISLDVENISHFPDNINKIYTLNFNKKKFCKRTNLNHLDNKSIVFYKLIKYFYFGTIHSFGQLSYLKKDIKKLNKIDLKLIVNSIKNSIPKEQEIIEKFIFWNFDKFIKNKETKNFFLCKRKIRHEKRRVFAGKLKFRNVIFSKKFICAFIFGTFRKWKITHNAMPAISIVGNDGSGKSTVVNYIRKNFSKMDPLIFDMKSNVPFFSFTFKIRTFLKKIKKSNKLNNIYYLSTIISFLGELIDIADKYLKYKIGMAWADAGYGLTLFERYPTDRIRGEFPNTKNKFIPLEQFFPLPDGLVYLDVLPKDSLIRKKKDNHTLDEMKSKRSNYLSLIKEFDEKQFLSPKINLDKKILNIKNYIFKIYNKKNNQIKKNGKVKRMIWKKNFKRKLAGKNLNKSQKEGFFD